MNDVCQFFVVSVSILVALLVVKKSVSLKIDRADRFDKRALDLLEATELAKEKPDEETITISPSDFPVAILRRRTW